MPPKNAQDLYKILIIGDTLVGKTSIIQRFSENTFAMRMISTVGIDFKSRVIDFDDVSVKLQIWDTAGQERFAGVTANFFRDAMGVLLIFDLTNKETFKNIQKWAKKVDDNAPDNTVRLLIGNKCDISEREREVTTQEGQELATQYQIHYWEVSALSGEKIQEAFVDAAREIRKTRKGKEGIKAEGKEGNIAIAYANAEKENSNCGC